MLDFNNKINSKIDKDINTRRQVEDNEKILHNPQKQRIKEDNFRDVYSSKEIESDLKLVERLQDKFASQLEHFSGPELKKIHEGEKRSEILEIIIASDGERYNWMGERARLQRASRFDDIINGIDVILEFEAENNSQNSDPIDRIALGIDASRNSDVYALQKKISRNIEKIKKENNKKLPQVKYFKSEIDKNFKGELKNIIPIVIGLDSNNVNKLIHLCAVSRSLADPEHKKELQEMGIDSTRRQKEIKNKLINHPAQVVFYQEIITQFNYYLKLLSNESDPQTQEIKNEINSLLNRVKKIAETKKDIPIANYDQDAVLKTIKNICS